MMLDMHTHVWEHGPGTPAPTYDQLANICDVANAAGITEIAITEHCHRFTRIVDEVFPHWEHDGNETLLAAAIHAVEVENGGDLDRYVEALVSAQDRGLPLLIGIEVDRIPGAIEPMKNVLDEYPFDVRLGSVHWLGSWLFDDYLNPAFAAEWATRDHTQVWTSYIDAIEELAHSGLADVLAHLDVIKVAGHRPDDLVVMEDRLAKVVAGSAMTVEVSSAGWRKPADEMYPSPTLLDRLVDLGVPLTTASDAHVTEHLGWEYNTLRRELTDRGVTELTCFTQRIPRRIPLT
jgi:histidinol-phosphatase (PHP family)